MQKIVTIGGGTGHFQVLKGLKNYDCDLTAVVNVSDDGGSSGRLRDEYGILPPGDLRQCIVALAPEDEQMALRKLFSHRFNDGHNLGNLIIAAATQIYGSEVEGIKVASRLLNIHGNVLPVSTDHCTLVIQNQKGEIIRGESLIDKIQGKNTRIQSIWLEPQAHLFREAAQKIREADKIVFCPGDLYGSLIPNLIVNGMNEALSQSSAQKIYVCNLFTKHGCYGFHASDFVREVEKYARIRIDHVLVNTHTPNSEVLGNYLSENSHLVEDDLEKNPHVTRGDFAHVYESQPNPIWRHDPEKIARAIVGIPNAKA